MIDNIALALASIETFRNQIVCCDALTLLRSLPGDSVHCIVTSPPYYGLRDYGTEGQIGLEDTPQAYVARLVEVFEQARRVLRSDGTCWIVLGDSWAGSNEQLGVDGSRSFGGTRPDKIKRYAEIYTGVTAKKVPSPKPKNLIGIPWRVAFALQDAGWYLRSEIIWYKPNGMPESVTDRPTKAHETVFLLSKSETYFYDQGAIREPASQATIDRANSGNGRSVASANAKSKKATPNMSYSDCTLHDFKADVARGRNKRTVWTIPTVSSPLPHFAMFPPKLIEPMILAGCPVGSLVLDPFIGTGTTALVARQHNRQFIGCDLNLESVQIARDRLRYYGSDKQMLKEQAAGFEQLVLFEVSV